MANKISDEKAKKLKKEVDKALDSLADLEIDLKKEEVGLIITKRA